MPRRAQTPCRYAGCGTLLDRPGYCEAHQRAVYRQIDAKRGTAKERGYDSAWRKLRAAFLMEHPLCECDDCQAGKIRVTPAEVVDHIKPISERPDLRLDPRNLRAMAKRCHDKRTGRDQAFGRGRGPQISRA